MPKTNEIETLERRFWDSMINKDAKTAAAMIAGEALVTGPQGAMKLNPEKYEEMAKYGDWSLTSYEMSDVEVVCPSDNVAIIAYKVNQKGDMKGQDMDLNCADSSTWVRNGDEWKCALHTESTIGEMPLKN